MNTEILIIIVFSLILIVWGFITLLALRVAYRSKKLSGKLTPISLLFLFFTLILITISFYYLWKVNTQISMQTTHPTTSSSYY